MKNQVRRNVVKILTTFTEKRFEESVPLDIFLKDYFKKFKTIDEMQRKIIHKEVNHIF